MIRRPWLAPLLLLAVSGMAWARRTLVMEQKHQDMAQQASEMAQPATSGWR